MDNHDELIVEEIIKIIKSKKELSGLDNDYVKKKINHYLLSNHKIKLKIENSESFKQISRSKELDELVKNIRKELRETYGVFDSGEGKKKEDLLKKIKKSTEKEIITEILATHQSTKERLSYYSVVYKKIFDITGYPKIILDIGCGLNPLSYNSLGCKPKYYCCDISSDDMKFIAEFFQKNKINGETFVCDAAREPEALKEKINEIKPDIIFMFKLLDSLESIKRHCTKKLLPQLKAKWIIVSFATISLGGKKNIADFKRTWFDKFLEKQKESGWSYDIIKIPNEIFYVIKIE